MASIHLFRGSTLNDLIHDKKKTSLHYVYKQVNTSVMQSCSIVVCSAKFAIVSVSNLLTCLLVSEFQLQTAFVNTVIENLMTLGVKINIGLLLVSYAYPSCRVASVLMPVL